MKVKFTIVDMDADDRVYDMKVWIDGFKVFNGHVRREEVNNGFLKNLEHAYRVYIGEELVKRNLPKILRNSYAMRLTTIGVICKGINKVLALFDYGIAEKDNWYTITKKEKWLKYNRRKEG
jgi:hypothetical protein